MLRLRAILAASGCGFETRNAVGKPLKKTQCLRAWVLKEKGQAAKHSSVVVYAEGVRLSANRPKPRYCTGSHASTEGEATAELFPREAEDDSREHVVAHKT